MIELLLRHRLEVRPLAAEVPLPAFKVLVFSKTAGFRHGSIATGISNASAPTPSKPRLAGSGIASYSYVTITLPDDPAGT